MDYNALILTGFCVCVLLNLRDLPMLCLSFAGLIILGVISPALPTLNDTGPILIAMWAEFTLMVTALAVGMYWHRLPVLYASLCIAVCSFFNLASHVSAVFSMTNMGLLPEAYELQLRSGEVLQLVTVFLFSRPLIHLGAWLTQRGIPEGTDDGSRRMVNAFS